ncbi:MAG: adenylate/guanylate cyclase domain-containing protein [Commensalibacter sp.]|nr:adenylate/guanylate cyclase domain-containing protein [Commensalibacter sp.]
MGGHIVAVAGCSKTFDPTAPVRLAHAALDIRSACIELIATTQSDSSFGIGIAVGPSMGTWLGKDPQVFNLWGPTVMRASLMAGMAREGGTIQVTESAYAFLRKDFLFRPRGSFFVPKVGVSRTFILAGRR